MTNTPPPLESRFVRYTRRMLFAFAIALPLGIGAYDVSVRFGPWWLSRWVQVGLLVVVGVGLVGVVLRLAHALFASAQYVLSELMLTFFVAAFVSMGLVEWLKFGLGSEQIQFITIFIVVATFGVFLAGSGWSWGVFRRVEDFPAGRITVLVCGWVSAVGLTALAIFLLFTLMILLSGHFPSDARRPYYISIAGSLLTIPGVAIELSVKRSLAAKKFLPSLSAPNPSPPSAL